MFNPIKTTDFSAIRLRVASPDDIKSWSHGEIVKPETINYRTQRPEKDGLFCERIFGPSKDWECYCGKYKKIRYKGITCDKCGVEVTRAIVRRERMGHIELAVPVTHIWFLRSVPSKIGLILDLSVQNLEKVVYFANFIVTDVNEELKQQTVDQIKQEYKGKKKSIEAEINQQVNRVKTSDKSEKEQASEIEKLELNRDQRLDELEEVFKMASTELKELKILQIISESKYQDLSLKYGHVFEAGIGAEAINAILEKIDIPQTVKDLEKLHKKSTGAKKDKLVRRIKLLKSLEKNGIHPSWMIMKALPVIPPDLRPMVPLDGGRFATSDLNDLYRRVINRNNRLKQLIELRAPEVITRNEKRMLQEAVDALIDNGMRHGKTVTASTGQKRQLKSIADILKGKQGRFRQNLLGKRTDYSGRSVIVVGPNLSLDECGLPKKMALELFKPFVISRLIEDGYVHNVRSAGRFIDADHSEVWDILAEVIEDKYIFINRAPTLHRLGIQAFKPILIEGKAIQVHPLVCTAFNADFDGDQMAVHLPLTKEAQAEARDIMLSTKNLLKPATGEPISTPSKDMVWGAYFMTSIRGEDKKKDVKELKRFSDPEEAVIAYNLRTIHLRERVLIRFVDEKGLEDGVHETCVGRVLFNRDLPEEMDFMNEPIAKKEISKIISSSFELLGTERTAQLLDTLKNLGFEYITLSGWSWGMDDIPTLKEKPAILEAAELKVDEVENQFQMGLLTKSERYGKIIEIWTKAKDEIVEASHGAMDVEGPVHTMVESGARGSWGQLTQIVGMKGLVTNPAGEIIELPVRGNFKDGFDILEYFISTHGARKGLSDTALRTASAGYLTRRLVDVAQDVVIRIEDCGTTKELEVTRSESEAMNRTLRDRIIGRYLTQDVGKVGKKDELITDPIAQAIDDSGVESAFVRTVMECEALSGICQKCYGWDLGHGKEVAMGTAVGIIAAQSIGEPGTQLTMRTFHTGGIASSADITQGLPRVEELLESRNPKRKAFISEVTGKLSIEEVTIVNQDLSKANVPNSSYKQKVIKIDYMGEDRDAYKIAGEPKEFKFEEGDEVKANQVLYITEEGKQVKAKRGGTFYFKGNKVEIGTPMPDVKEYVIPLGYSILVKDGQEITKGTALTEGHLNLQELFELRDRHAAQKYIIEQIQDIYGSQGQKLNDKHVEIMCRQLFSRVMIKDAGETNLLPGEIAEFQEVLIENIKAQEAGKKLATYDRRLLGITKVSLTTRSFLSAASFQETAKVLINAAINGRLEPLEGLKENVIIGRLIPAGTGWDARVKADAAKAAREDAANAPIVEEAVEEEEVAVAA